MVFVDKKRLQPTLSGTIPRQAALNCIGKPAKRDPENKPASTFCQDFCFEFLLKFLL